MVILDTSSLIRFFTKDNAKKAQKVKDLLESKKDVYIPEVVYPELEYVLSKEFDQSRQKLIKIFRFLISLPNHKVTKNVKMAVNVFEKSRLDMADCLIAAHSIKGSLASFDKDLLNLKGVHKYWRL